MQALFWSGDIGLLDANKDKRLIIHKVLSCGSLSDLKWLFNNYSKSTVKNVFLANPKKFYTPSAFNFISRHLLRISKKPDKKRYVKNIY